MMQQKKQDKKFLLFLINPRQKYVNYYAQTELSHMIGVRKFMLPLALPMIAALVPDDFDIRIIDEETHPLDDSVLPDIVALSALASTAGRSYELADHYRSLGIPVIIGGPHVSFCPDEALQHCSSIVVGEAEELWPQSLNDFARGALQPIYKREGFCDYRQSPPPRWDLVPREYFFQVGVQISRGCPYHCEFCLVTELFGRKMRYRDLDNVVDELKSLPVKKVFFVDDNLTVNKRYAFELMERIKPLHLSWACMASIEIADQPDLLKAMKDAGCFNILIGFESLNPGSLDETHKKQNHSAATYKESIAKIHRHGIHITASFMIGFDHDTQDEFERIYQFTQETGLSYINFNIVGAIPGSALHARLQAEGRLYPIDPELISGLFPTMHYYTMGQVELFDLYLATLRRMYSWESLYEKARNLFGPGSFTAMFHDGAPPAGFQFKVTLGLLKQWISRDASKRKLFAYLFRCILRKQVAIDNACAFLLSMIGYHNHIEKLIGNAGEYRALIRKHDQGAWKDQLNQLKGS